MANNYASAAKNLKDSTSKEAPTPDSNSSRFNSSQFLTRKEAAQFLGVKEGTLSVWACNKRYNLPFYKIGRLSKYLKSDLEKFALDNQVGGANA